MQKKKTSELPASPESVEPDQHLEHSDTSASKTPVVHTCTPNISLCEKEMAALASALMSSFQSEIHEMTHSVMASTVQSIVGGVLSELFERIASLEVKNEKNC